MVGAIFSILGFLRPGQIPQPRRMVNYRVHYDDSLGTSPDITGVAELVVRRKGHDVPDASLVMIGISNEGGLDVPAGLLTGDQEQEGARAAQDRAEAEGQDPAARAAVRATGSPQGRRGGRRLHQGVGDIPCSLTSLCR